MPRETSFGLAEAGTGAALVAGWALVTLGVARYLDPAVVWPVSIGLLLLSLCGWGFLLELFTEGLYVLSRGRRE